MKRSRSSCRPVNGLLLLDKPTGLTANAALQHVKRRFNACKAGHTGALDPLASGMLPICFGEATKFSQFLLEADKTYQVTAQLGVRTDTADSEGSMTSVRPVNVTLRDVEQALTHFRGPITQRPSPYSALKYQGKPLYYYARRGIEVPPKVRSVVIHQLILNEFTGTQLHLTIHCSKGTYIRTVVDDLGELLGCGAHVIALRRLSVADYPSSALVTLAQVESLATLCPVTLELNFSALEASLLPVASLLTQLPEYNITPEEATQLQQGRTLPLSENAMNETVQLTVGLERRLLGVGERCAHQLSAKRLLSWTLPE
jgi:tRNA pseudouridine55 synthase